jgi:hypothetical protein
MLHWSESPQDAARRIKAWAHGVGDWWGSYFWSHVVHLTVDGRWSPERLLQRFEREYIRFAEKTAQCYIPYAFAIEGGVLGDQPHLHGLTYGTHRLSSDRLEHAWRFGRAQVAVYDPTLGAAHYLTKEIGGRVLDYGLSTRLPPLRVHSSPPPVARLAQPALRSDLVVAVGTHGR